MAQNDLLITTDIPARLDRLPWGRFHTLVVIALGITWILDGLEVTLAGSLAGALKESPALRFSNTDIGLASSAYLAGAVLGAIFFGWLTDRLGRKVRSIDPSLPLFEAVAKESPESDEFHFSLGKIHLMLGRYAEAEKAVALSLRKDAAGGETKSSQP